MDIIFKVRQKEAEVWGVAMKVKANLLVNPVLRDVALNRNELLKHAIEIAQSHIQMGILQGCSRLLPRVKENSEFLEKARIEMSEYEDQTKDWVPASEWFLDNFYLLKDLRLDIKKNLSRKYERELPCLASGEEQGVPRIFILMRELVEHTDSQVNGELLRDFVNAYQSVQPLTSGELWALPIMLKIILLENVRRLAEQVLLTQKERQKAESWITPFLAGEQSTEEWEGKLNSANAVPDNSTAYVERLLYRMRELGSDATPLVNWFNRVLSREDISMDGLAHLEHQKQAIYQVSMGHAITSIRFLAEENWPRFFEEISPVQKMLELDPSGIYPRMDFESRDKYRHLVEKVARSFQVSELVVARKLLDRAKERFEGPNAEFAHIGFDLFGAGYSELEIELEKEWGRIRRFWCGVKRSLRNKPHEFYLGGIFLTTLLLLKLLSVPFLGGVEGWGERIFRLFVLLIPVTALTIPLINWLVNRIVSPAYFPKLEFGEGIPSEFRTLVVIPTLLTSVERVKELLGQLEVYYLANQDPHLHFALLGDFKDAPSPEMSGDKELLEAGIERIRALNLKYREDAFLLLHRSRLWNPSEVTWMGWERKRGKLIELNRLLRQEGTTSYTVQIGKLEVLPKIHYVITLDADTELPRGVAKKLIGTMTHPLHIPRLGEDGRNIVKGYGVLQPRIGVSVLSARASRFTSLFSGNSGIDPYTTAVSDVYQDLFGEGSFTGKGIYDVEVFHRVTGEAFPENQILSHDLLEGIYARAGLVTDIELIDGYPAKYPAYMQRLHRWTRGDWQILPWLFKDISTLGKWKIFDNLRRSLEAPSQVLLLYLAFTLLEQNPYYWIGFVLMGIFWPLLIQLLNPLVKWRENSLSTREELKKAVLQGVFRFSTLAYQAILQLDAILRSLLRQGVTKRKLLEWETAADTEARLDLSFQTSLRSMWPTWGVIIVFLTGILYYDPTRLILFLPVALLWGLSPYFAYWISLPYKMEKDLSEENQAELRLWSRKIWAFFEEYVTAEENWLPPDNVQIDPPNGIAHRTSPTNIGLAMLANRAARDEGYLTLGDTLTRLRGSLNTLEQLEQWDGHFYNWYDTLTLHPLQPLYISTVDSGNLVVSLLTLSHGVEDLLEEPVLSLQVTKGLQDTYHIARGSWGEDNVPEKLEALGTEIEDLLLNSEDLWFWQSFLERWSLPLELDSLEASSSEETGFWVMRLEHMIQALNKEFERFYPRTMLLALQSLGEPGLSLQGLGRVGVRELQLRYAQEICPKLNSEELKMVCRNAEQALKDFMEEVESLTSDLRRIALETNFRPLYNPERQLFSIGYRVADRILDSSYYDLLASEARQASFIAIAKGDVPQAHWFHLGRSLTQVKGQRSLVSWSGTMFEFLMPLLLMRNFPGTLLDETYQAVVEIQRQYGESQGIPWGISESGYYLFDPQLNYQYKAFGVPGLGLKRGLTKELVLAPYATFMALQVAPLASLKNIQQMAEFGFTGRFGLFEAIDYTRERIALKKEYEIIKSYMTHHQGMSFLALENVLGEGRMQKRFHRDPLVQASELLLQERVPVGQKIIPPPEVHVKALERKEGFATEGNRFMTYTEVDTVVPLTHFVSNGQYSVMLTNSGSGFSRFGTIAVSRWREDVTRDSWGMYFYIQNLNSGDFWSPTYQPCRNRGEDYQVTYAPDRVEYYRKDGNVSTKLEVVVSPEDPVELRRISLTNHSSSTRELEITSYFETVLTRPNDDLAHPAFTNLFIQTEYTHQAILASRRPRRPEQGRSWLMHTLALEGEGVGSLQYETDRARFIGRGRSLKNPQALELNQPLSNSVGAVLNPIMSLRQRVLIKPGQTARMTFTTGIAEERESIIRLAEKYREAATVNRAFELAWTQSQMELRHLNMTANQANEALSLGGQILYLSPARRAYSSTLKENSKGQSALWPYAISGDLPIVLVKVKNMEHLEFVRQVLKVHEYWKMKGLFVDIVFLNEDETGYLQALQDALKDIVSAGHSHDRVNQPGGVFLLQQNHIPPEILTLLFTVARVILAAEEGSLTVQLRKKGKEASEVSPHSLSVREGGYGVERVAGDSNTRIDSSITLTELKNQLLYFNGFGGFTEDGREYVLELKEGTHTPLPWINVIANPHFGFQISESGAGYTWSGNSRENKLTSWSNDPVLDTVGEGVVIRDDETGALWGPTPAPLREGTSYQVHFGQGYSRFKHRSSDIETDYLLYVPIDKPVKIARLLLQNDSGAKHRLTVSYYAEWVLGVARELTAPYIVTDFHEASEALLVWNTYQEEFAGRVAFLSGFGGECGSYTGDREEWLGRNGDFSEPQGATLEKLSGSYGAGFDPCGVLQRVIELEPNQEMEVLFLVGEGDNREDALALIQEFRNFDRVEEAYREVVKFWDNHLGKLQIHTPDQSMNLLMNRWLLYQTLACRIWARSAFYQSGGAFGFRDQLQDVMSFASLSPEYTREQILRHCAHQFIEGDVQHWWHEEANKGIRTKFADDLLWLPFVTADYIEHTEDYSILEEVTPFLKDCCLGEEEDERYSIPQVSEEQGTVYEHCIRALERGIKLGEHGLPLIGSGDWNDGFSRIGIEGKGESVWLGWFLITTLSRFTRICDECEDHSRAEDYRQMVQQLKESMERAGWDGGWYRRAYFDDGTPLGSARNVECQIDAIAQSWSVISGGARESRAKDAMAALENYLWKKEEGILLLLTPPFIKSDPDPGYIQGYVPGVRENGGQYTHGAIWSILAFSMLGEGNKAAELFNMLNPINHARTSQEVARYKVEPYVMAADVYAISPHTGRGGWTWYTGAAGWMYQAGLEGILGFDKQGEEFSLKPCIPDHWPSYEMEYRYKSSVYRIRVENPHRRMGGVQQVFFDQDPGQFPIKLLDDGQEHWVRVIL